MTIEEIFSLWEQDAKIDVSELSAEAGNVPPLQHKYYKIFIAEKLNLKKLEAKAKKLKLAKYEFYTQGPSEDTPKDWDLPAIGRILKADLPMYLDADDQMIELNLMISHQTEKVALLQSIIESIKYRGNIIKSIIQWEIFKDGK